jgi:hypothetical protein
MLLRPYRSWLGGVGLVVSAACATTPRQPAQRAPVASSSCSSRGVNVVQECAASQLDSLSIPQLLDAKGARRDCEQPRAEPEEGTVRLEAHVDASARVAFTRVVRSYPACDAECVLKVVTSRFQAAQGSRSSEAQKVLLICRPN